MATNSLDLDFGALIERVRASRDKAVRWVLDHIDSDGKPVGADDRNGWSRVPWALAVCGESEVGSAVLGWAERSQLAPDGGFAPGPAYGDGTAIAYAIGHFAIGAWLLEHTGTALGAMRALRAMQDPATGGFSYGVVVDRTTDYHDLLCTAQVGLAAVITGQDDIAANVYRWVADLVAMQPADAGQRLYVMRQGSDLLVNPPEKMAWRSITDFSKPRQTYFTPGMAAVFLSAYAGRSTNPAALALARQLLQFNIEGTSAQFEDIESVQICKFGWAAAAMLVADPHGDWLPHVARMGDWFIEHQADDGSWGPSTFMVPNADDVFKLSKTAEHLMEINAILAALGTARGRKLA